jgi:hypothetical protein
LYGEIASQHGVPAGMVSEALGRNRGLVDLAENLPFSLFYCLVAIAVARWLLRRYPPADNGWLPIGAMGLSFGLAMAVVSAMQGEVVASILESSRIGNGHISYRMQRLWWGRHRAEVFAASMIVFAATMVVALRRSPPQHVS